MVSRAGTSSAGVRRRDGGQAVGLVLMSVALVAAVAVGVMSLAQRMVDRSEAQTAADAAALAGVNGGASAAADAASRNGARLQSFERTGGGEAGFVVTVTVGIGDEQAVARASSLP